ncbi:hypothetical protein [Phaeobacter italicus]|uniref:hypothetical protein n=1 Tax=Phaeobacter italicus TaxID=481446 RepID=UPI00242DBFA5|nr:hypothetical protein [Phaeobacter italicus]MCI5101158.1 hypothetical protein [Phaeobacter italicus]
MIQSPRAQLLGIEGFKRFRGLGIGGHQPCLGHTLHQDGFAAQVSIAPPSLGPRDAPVYGKRGFGFGVAPVRKIRTPPSITSLMAPFSVA